MKELVLGAAYVRVSTNDQTELSPDAQIREIRKSAKADGYVIPNEFIFLEKKGISGRRADNREEFQRMIAMAKMQPQPFQRLYLWKFSRFARNQEESTFYKGILRKKCGIDIKSVSEPIMDGMFGRLIETIIEWFDEYYSYNLSGEVLRGMTEKALRKGYQSTPCLGYAAVGGGRPFVISEKEYRIVEYIATSFHNGMDATAIARELNNTGCRTRRGNLFDHRSICRILTNEFYNGIVSWNGISFQGCHETRACVTSIFEENQKRIRQEYRPARRREASSCKHWASGLLRCGYCGANLTYCKGNGNRNDLFQCWRYSKGHHKGSCSISIKKAEEAILESLYMAIEADQAGYVRMQHLKEQMFHEEYMIKDSLERLDSKEVRIRNAYEYGIDTLEEYQINKLRLQQERNELLKKSKPQSDISEHAVIQTVCSLLTDPDISFEQKGNALRGIIKEIVYDRQNNELRFCYYLIENE